MKGEVSHRLPHIPKNQKELCPYGESQILIDWKQVIWCQLSGNGVLYHEAHLGQRFTHLEYDLCLDERGNRENIRITNEGHERRYPD